MTQRQLNRLVSQATGESRRTIGRLGFSIADPLAVAHDPEATCDSSPDDDLQDAYLAAYIDWDCVQANRQGALV